MDDKQREIKKKKILSYIGAVAQPAKLYAVDYSGNELIEKYNLGIKTVKNSKTVEDDEQGWNLIIEAFRGALHIAPEIELKPNLSPDDFKENLDTIFKSIGIQGGVEDILDYQEGRKQTVGQLIAQARVEKMDTKTEEAAPKLEEPAPDSISQNHNIFNLKISELPTNICSEELISKLSQGYKYIYVYELLTTSYDELVWVLKDGSEIPIKFLVELEYFFRINKVDFLDTITGPTLPQDEVLKRVIEKTVTIALTHNIGHQKTFE